MSLRTAIPALIASILLAGFAPASSADETTQIPLVPTAPPVPAAKTVAPAPVQIQQATPAPLLVPTTTVPPAIVPVITEPIAKEPTTTEPLTTEPTTPDPTTEPPTTEPTTVPPALEPPVTTGEPTVTAEPTSVTATPTTSMPTETTETTETTAETTTTETTTPTTTPPPTGDLTLTTSSITGTDAEIGARTVRLTFTVDVADTRTEGGWTASARVSNLVGTRDGVTLPSSVSYSSSSTACSTSTGTQTLGGDDVVVHRTDEPCSASWTVTATIELPEGADIADVYMATVEHSLTATPMKPAAPSSET